jgi:hypothetical protein
LDQSYLGLCDYACNHGNCPEATCDTCVAGTGATGGYDDLCGFTCQFGYCPPGPCTCSTYGARVEPPAATGPEGISQEGLDESYRGLCSYACNHNYCPPADCRVASGKSNISSDSSSVPLTCPRVKHCCELLGECVVVDIRN